MGNPGTAVTAVGRELQRRRRRRLIVAAILVLVPALVLFSLYRQASRTDQPVEYASDEEHFKYGSIGSDRNGIPYWIWRTMPEVCADRLPGGYASLGVVQEPGKDTPVGFSKRRVGLVDQVAPNCGLCHTARVRHPASARPEVYVAAPAHQLNLGAYFKFLFTCGRDPDFNTDNFLTAIGRHTKLSWFDRIVYRLAVPRVRAALVEGGKKFDSITAERPDWGPGRVDTFNPYKVLVFNMDMKNDRSIGTADFLSIWNQAPREGVWLHWDGNNDSVDERNLSAAIGAGATPDTLDHDRIQRVKRWILTRAAPRYPFDVDLARAAAGRQIYAQYCASCHDLDGAFFGTVTPLARLGTDPERNAAFDKGMAERMNTIGDGYPWHFHRFRTTNGYANHPLDGIWLRAPYLHNGSVPTLRDLLNPPEARPTVFYRGNDLYDPAKVGFVHDIESENGRKYFKFDTRERGNGNKGHVYGADLPDEQKRDLLEYLKTL
jgi:hypothetical protein